MTDLRNIARDSTNKKIEQQLIKTYSNDRLIYGYGGGLFKISPELIVMMSLFEENTHPVFDMYGTPVMIEDIEQFTKDIKERYFEVCNQSWKKWQDTDAKYK